MVKVQDSTSDKIGIILKRWQEKLIDVSKANPLLGINRSRSPKLEIDSPDLNNIVKVLFTDGASFKLPFVQKKVKKAKAVNDEEIPIENEEFIYQEGDIDFIYPNLNDLRKKIRKIFDSLQLTVTSKW